MRIHCLWGSLLLHCPPDPTAMQGKVTCSNECILLWKITSPKGLKSIILHLYTVKRSHPPLGQMKKISGSACGIAPEISQRKREILWMQFHYTP